MDRGLSTDRLAVTDRDYPQSVNTKKPPPPEGRRLLGMIRFLTAGHRRVIVGGVLAAGIVIDLALLAPSLAVVQALVQGGDLILLQSVTLQWQSGGDFYPAYQLVGPYQDNGLMILYPPTALVLFLPFTVLPAVLWWLGPLAIIAGTIRYWRPRPTALVAIVICAASYPMIVVVNQGNPTMWIEAFVALGTRWPAFAALVFLKPSMFPFALLGIRHRNWWVVTALLAALSLVMLPMTIDWLTSMLNMRGGRSGLLYSLPDAVVLAIPLIAWVGRSSGLRDSVDADHARGDVAGRGNETEGGQGRSDRGVLHPERSRDGGRAG